MRFNAICKAVCVKPYDWQADYALHRTPNLPFPAGRCTGKTTACMLRLLMAPPLDCMDVLIALAYDPDFHPEIARSLWFYDQEYAKMSHACILAGIDVVESRALISDAVRKYLGKRDGLR